MAPVDVERRGLYGRFVKDWLAPEAGRTALAAMALIGVAAGNSMLPVVIARAVDKLNPQEAHLLYWAPLVVLPVIGLKAISSYFGSGLIEKVAQETILRLRTALFRHVTAGDLARLSADRSGAIASRFVSDMSVLRDAMARALRNLAVDLFSVCGLLAAMLYLDWLLTLTALAALGLGGVPILVIGARLRRISADVQGRFGRMTSFLAEHFASARLIKTHRLETRQEKRATAAFAGLRDTQMQAAWSRAKVEPIMEFLGAIAVCGVLALAAYFVGSGRARIGDFAGFIAALLLAAQHARRLGTLHVVVQEGAAALERVFDALDAPPAIVDRAHARPLKDPRGEIRFESVRFAYADAPALNDLDFHARPGETVALVGPSGAGKSTVFNLLLRLYEPQAGRISIGGQDVRDVTLASLRDAIAFVAQDVTLLDDTIGANIAFGRPGADEAAIVDAARAAQADGFVRECVGGYDTQVGERGMALSGGQRQRIALARAILKDAPILLLDEATSALDPESERAVQAALETARRGRTTLVIAHRLSTVRSADRIVVLDAGRVVEDGRHDELCARGGLYASLAGADFSM